MTTIPLKPNGYYIVGSQFFVSNETSSTPRQPDVVQNNPSLSTNWGDTTCLAVNLASGYCWNRFLNRRGYGVLTVYLKDADEVAEDQLVVANGFTLIRVGDNKQQILDERPPYQQYGMSNIWTKQNEWLLLMDNLGATINFAGHFETWDQAKNRDGYGKIYFDVRRAVSTDVNGQRVHNGLKVSGGGMSIGTAGLAHTYKAREWGHETAQSIVVASCRTWPTKGLSYAGHDYDNANGFAYVYRASS